MVAPEEKYFAGHPAKPTIQEMLDNASSELGIQIPLTDLFDLGTDESHHVDHFGLPCRYGNCRRRRSRPLRAAERRSQLGDLDRQGRQAGAGQGNDRRSDRGYAAALCIDSQWTVPATIPDDAFTFTPSGDHKSIAFALGAPKLEGAQ